MTDKEKFLQLFQSAIKEGYSCNDARDFASLEVCGDVFHKGNKI